MSGARGKNGGILFARNHDEASRAFLSLFESTVNGHVVKEILIEERLEILAERYMGVLVDSGDVWLLIGRDGGVDVEEASQRDPDSIVRIPIDFLRGIPSAEVFASCERLGLTEPQRFVNMAERLWKAFRAADATTAEINPVAELADGSLAALDSRVVVDDSALFRHPEHAQKQTCTNDGSLSPPLENLKELGGGKVLYAGIGGGIGLTIADWIADEGQNVAALLDIDDLILHHRTREGTLALLDRLDNDESLRVAFLNITTCGYDLAIVANDVFAALAARPRDRAKPVVFHFHGKGEDESRRLFDASGMRNFENLKSAITEVVSIASREAGK
ncbi:succinyl-CoA synthetase beta subunit [Ensifer mexicanus]|nr:succinyl-CoA synthetase beta subunit [Sinorhizobium mexicanum]